PYNSALANGCPSLHTPQPGSLFEPSTPPATRTRPSGSTVAVAPARPVVMSPVAVHVPVSGSYSSALDKLGQKRAWLPQKSWLPATSTCPLGSRASAGSSRGNRMLPVATQRPVRGSYNWAAAEASMAPPPPRTSTCPVCSSVAV